MVNFPTLSFSTGEYAHASWNITWVSHHHRRHLKSPVCRICPLRLDCEIKKLHWPALATGPGEAAEFRLTRSSSNCNRPAACVKIHGEDDSGMDVGEAAERWQVSEGKETGTASCKKSC